MLYLQNVWLLLFTQIDLGSIASPHPTPSDVCTKSPLHLCLTSQGRSPNKDVRWHNRRIRVAHNLQPSVTRHVIRHDLLLLLQLLNPQSRYSLNSNIAKQNLAFGMCLGRKLIFFLPGLIHMQNERLRKIAVRQVAMQQSTRRNDVRWLLSLQVVAEKLLHCSAAVPAKWKSNLANLNEFANARDLICGTDFFAGRLFLQRNCT